MLREIGVRFETRPAGIDEARKADESPPIYVERMAREKGSQAATGELTLAADTVVVLDDEILGKPRDRAEARTMLRRLAERDHQVLSGVALHDGTSGRVVTTVAESRVRMAAMTDEEIAWYAHTGETDDKAGSYGIQGLGALFVVAVYGSYSNVVGLPLLTTYRLFQELDHDLRSFREAPKGAASSR